MFSVQTKAFWSGPGAEMGRGALGIRALELGAGSPTTGWEVTLGQALPRAGTTEHTEEEPWVRVRSVAAGAQPAGILTQQMEGLACGCRG